MMGFASTFALAVVWTIILASAGNFPILVNNIIAIWGKLFYSP
jgi:hypothetical protein